MGKTDTMSPELIAYAEAVDRLRDAEDAYQAARQEWRRQNGEDTFVDAPDYDRLYNACMGAAEEAGEAGIAAEAAHPDAESYWGEDGSWEVTLDGRIVVEEVVTR